MPAARRLIDLHCPWLRQYAAESTLFDQAPASPAAPAPRFGQVAGYLLDAGAAVIACGRDRRDWAERPDRWGALADLLTRVEAEFTGRVLAGPDDHARWLDDPDGLCWALLGVSGFDALVREPGDLDRLPALFARGVRVFQPVETADNALAGAAVEGDDRGLSPLGRSFLDILADLASAPDGPRPVLDLAGLGPTARAAALEWCEQRPGRVLPLYSHGAIRHEGFPDPRALGLDDLRRLRALGGLVALSVGRPYYGTAEALRGGLELAASVPFLGREGIEGVAIGTAFLDLDETLPGLENVEAVIRWLETTFPGPSAAALIAGNGQRLIDAATGGPGFDYNSGRSQAIEPIRTEPGDREATDREFPKDP